jgi:hypothetical protein
METQKFMGAGQMLDRLTEQMRTQKNPPKDPRAAAIEVLQKRGHLKEDGKTFTASGQLRNGMTAEERAKDRAARASNKPTSAYAYDPRTNLATLKKR